MNPPNPTRIIADRASITPQQLPCANLRRFGGVSQSMVEVDFVFRPGEARRHTGHSARG
jgi:hypothetical protein